MPGSRDKKKWLGELSAERGVARSTPPDVLTFFSFFFLRACSLPLLAWHQMGKCKIIEQMYRCNFSSPYNFSRKRAMVVSPQKVGRPTRLFLSFYSLPRTRCQQSPLDGLSFNSSRRRDSVFDSLAFIFHVSGIGTSIITLCVRFSCLNFM